MKCIGFFGKIFGHKFVITLGGKLSGTDYTVPYCARCNVLRADLQR